MRQFLAYYSCRCSTATDAQLLDPAEGLEVRLDRRVFVDRSDVVPSRHGTAIFAHTGKSGPRNAAYSIDFLCPTINSGDVTIYDDRIGVYRRLNLSERSRIQGFKEFKFSKLVPLAKHAGFLGRSMDLSSVDSWLVNIKEYLQPFKPHCCLSNSERHKGCGHPGREVSAVMGIPYPKHCALCEQGNCTKAPGSSEVKPRVTQYGHTQHLDFKISATPGNENVTVLMGATDDATNFQEIYPMTKRSEVLHVMRPKMDSKNLLLLKLTSWTKLPQSHSSFSLTLRIAAVILHPLNMY